MLYFNSNRVATLTLPLQLFVMRDYTKKRHWAVAVEVQDVESGATTHPQREKLIAAARAFRLDKAG